jgi:hypothetical protein
MTSTAMIKPKTKVGTALRKAVNRPIKNVVDGVASTPKRQKRKRVDEEDGWVDDETPAAKKPRKTPVMRQPKASGVTPRKVLGAAIAADNGAVAATAEAAPAFVCSPVATNLILTLLPEAKDPDPEDT